VRKIKGFGVVSKHVKLSKSRFRQLQPNIYVKDQFRCFEPSACIVHESWIVPADIEEHGEKEIPVSEGETGERLSKTRESFKLGERQDTQGVPFSRSKES
jgi:hypothetical protein